MRPFYRAQNATSRAEELCPRVSRCAARALMSAVLFDSTAGRPSDKVTGQS
jgi:hypothetical protein